MPVVLAACASFGTDNGSTSPASDGGESSSGVASDAGQSHEDGAAKIDGASTPSRAAELPSATCAAAPILFDDSFNGVKQDGWSDHEDGTGAKVGLGPDPANDMLLVETKAGGSAFLEWSWPIPNGFASMDVVYSGVFRETQPYQQVGCAIVLRADNGNEEVISLEVRDRSNYYVYLTKYAPGPSELTGVPVDVAKDVPQRLQFHLTSEDTSVQASVRVNGAPEQALSKVELLKATSLKLLCGIRYSDNGTDTLSHALDDVAFAVCPKP